MKNKRLYGKLLPILFFMFCFGTALFTEASTHVVVSNQPITIKGKVLGTDGISLPGVNVIIKGTTKGVITDLNGNYSIEIQNREAVLVFSFIGFQSQKITVNAQSTINVTLEDDVKSLDEVIVVGYGTQRKKDITGSISRVSGDEMLQPSVATFDKMLQGRVAGVHISQTTGAPGGNVNILVRGISSITGGNQPLYVIDGFPIDIRDGSSNTRSMGGNTYSSSSMSNNTVDRINPLAAINPSDIESIEILKDASATAIYGSRGANGVVIITTKRGSSTKSQINVDISYGVQEVAHKIELMDAQEYMEYVVEGRDAAWVYSTGGSPNDPDEIRRGSQRAPTGFRNPSSITTNTDWQDVIFRVAPVQNYQISASGGNEKIKYLLSGGYLNQQGIILTSDYQRFNIRANIDAQVLEKVKISSTISGYYGLGSYPNTEGHYGLANPLMQALTASPTIPVYDENGNPYFNKRDVVEGLGWLFNPLTVLNKDNYSDDRTKANLMVNNYLEYKIMDGLIFKSSIGINYSASTIKLWRSNAVPRFTSLNYPATAGVTKTEGISWLNENTFAYKRLFKEKHSFDALLGFTIQKSSGERLSAGATDFPTNYVTYLSAGTVNAGTHTLSQWSMLSLIGRVNYSYAGKYLLTATVRRDGSSKFGLNNKWGTFPSFSFGYNISEESFMKSFNVFQNS
ncbi:MAG: SusC/RagA family TonB-linked outer membrane protein [Draconibacterium sp.]|nr:SusC/RagA family TonB-linked outer membrane protein [Draconibacterium sp.]